MSSILNKIKNTKSLIGNGITFMNKRSLSLPSSSLLNHFNIYNNSNINQNKLTSKSKSKSPYNNNKMKDFIIDKNLHYLSSGFIFNSANLSYGNVFDIVLLSLGVITTIITNQVVDYPCFNDNKEFQEGFERVLQHLDQKNIDNFEIQKEFEAIYSDLSISEPGQYEMKYKPAETELLKIIKTLQQSSIGHQQPETLENIKRIISILKEVPNSKRYNPFGCYFSLTLILSELVDDCNECEAVIPLLTELALNNNLTVGESSNIIEIFIKMSKEPKLRTLLAENNTVSALLKSIDHALSYKYNKYYELSSNIIAINDIVNNVDEQSLNNIDENEKELIRLCRNDKSSIWVNRLNINIISWGISLLVSLPTLAIPPQISLPSIAGFGIIYTLSNAYSRLLQTKIFKHNNGFFMVPIPFISIVALRNFPILFQPIIGYILGRLLVNRILNEQRPYSNLLPSNRNKL